MQDKKKTLAAVSPLLLVSLMGLMSGCQTEVMGTRSYNPNIQNYGPDGSEIDTSAYTPVPQPMDEETGATTAVLQPENDTDFIVSTTEEEMVTAPNTAQAVPAAPPAKTQYAPFPQSFPPPKVSQSSTKASKPATSSSKVAAGGTYTVQSGDSFWKIAHKHGVSVNALIAANNLSAKQTLQIGQKLIIPGGKTATATASTASSAAPKATTGTSAKKTGASKQGSPIPADGIHVVKSGDSLWKIANYYQISQEAIRKENNFGANPVLQVGQKIKLPRSGATTAPVKTTPATPAANDNTSSGAPLSGTAPAGTANEFINALGASEGAASAQNPPAASVETPAPVNPPAAAPAAVNTPSKASAPVNPPAAAPATGPEVKAPTAPAANAAAPDLEPTLAVTVKEETPLANLAKLYNVSEEVLRQYNVDIPENGIVPAGKSLLLPE